MPQYNHHHSLGHLTGLASRLFNRLLTTRFKQAGIEITAEQWGVILLLQNQGELTQNQICELLYLEKSSVSRSIASLEKRGWIQRMRLDTDSRSKLVALTEQSLSVVETCAEIANSVLVDAQHNQSSSELERSRQHLADVITNLRKLNQ
ncbi:MarR family transcriptional regulator [Shewanella sp. Isolate11]|uniref:MarR family winged helix-turn-helix transcriptional regulator n=1 Tax=Shewanella sp. Isolate11 TaxID=2908530 RepID=UPI001EFE4668|nr:MarR family transcriptional regulator [Shewanella sp. Isolate11]MCG9698344.1 MarR family transcriptional regulator [Shewanella sp. Isolate11]